MFEWHSTYISLRGNPVHTITSDQWLYLYFLMMFISSLFHHEAIIHTHSIQDSRTTLIIRCKSCFDSLDLDAKRETETHSTKIKWFVLANAFVSVFYCTDWLWLIEWSHWHIQRYQVRSTIVRLRTDRHKWMGTSNHNMMKKEMNTDW
jgi:hypothetical protein